MTEKIVQDTPVPELVGSCTVMRPRSRDRWRNAFAQPVAAVSFTSKLWTNGETVKVSFEDRLVSDPEMMLTERIKGHIRHCHSHVGLKLEFVPTGQGDVRISYTRGGSWSYIGTDCKLIPRDQHTMQLGWLTLDSSEDEIQRVVRHEYGIHAFGLGHEQKSPNANIPWDKQAVYADYAKQGWDKARVDHNVFGSYDASEVGFTDFDPTSLSQYPVKCRHVTVSCQGEYYIGWNLDFSPSDIEHLQSLYPKPDDTCNKLDTNYQRLRARRNSINRLMRRNRRIYRKRGC